MNYIVWARWVSCSLICCAWGLGKGSVLLPFFECLLPHCNLLLCWGWWRFCLIFLCEKKSKNSKKNILTSFLVRKHTPKSWQKCTIGEVVWLPNLISQFSDQKIVELRFWFILENSIDKNILLPLSKFKSWTTELIVSNHFVQSINHPRRVVRIQPP